MALYTSSYLTGLSRNKSYSFSQGLLLESKKLHTGFDIFLSHSFLDKEVIEGLYIELTRFGFSVYVDWIIDPNTDRNNVTKATATKIRERMQASKSLLLAVSENASLSKWIPWELGFMDKHTNKCAVVPVSTSINAPTSFKGSEYLSLYPFIKKHSTGFMQDKLWVIESSQTYVSFDDWLKYGSKPEFKTVSIY